MVWDLEEMVDGFHLPCSWARPSQLVPYLHEAIKQVHAFEAIENLSLDVLTENWTQQHRSASRFIEWAQGRADFALFPINEVQALQQEFYKAPKPRNLTVVHADWWQGNVMTRDRQVPVVLDWDEVHLGEPAEMYGRHWILMCSEPRWQEEVVTALGKRDDRFWLAFHTYAWMGGIDQIHYELTIFQGRDIDNHKQLVSVSPKRARFVDQMLKSLKVLTLNLRLGEAKADAAFADELTDNSDNTKQLFYQAKCGREDSNLHGQGHRLLRPARLPVPPRPRMRVSYEDSRWP